MALPWIGGAIRAGAREAHEGDTGSDTDRTPGRGARCPGASAGLRCARRGLSRARALPPPARLLVGADAVSAQRRRTGCAHSGRRGVLCASCRRVHRRQYAREWARRQRARAREAALVGAGRCPQRLGRRGRCGGPLETRVGEFGRTVVVCLWCERRQRGLCRDCDRPVAGARGKALRCALHRKLAAAAAQARYRAGHRAILRERARQRERDPARRPARLEYKRLYRQARPEKVRGQKARYARRQTLRAQRYQARYKARHREYYRELARQRHSRLHPTRPEPTCRACGQPVPWDGTHRPPTTCDRCCTTYELRRRVACWTAREDRAIAAEWAERVAPRARRPARPVARPRQPARRLPTGERLCWNRACATVVTGRAKKCADCIARERRAARAAIARRLEAHVA